jgi:hypothetical protein
MRIRRGLLFWGLFLIPLGAIPLLSRAGILDPDMLSEAWRLWPLILVGLGVALVLGRGQASVIGIAIAAIVFGIAGGSALASGGWIGTFASCGDTRDPAQVAEARGGFEGTATVVVDVRCGDIDLTMGPETAWRVDARYGQQAPTIDSTGTKLAVTVPDEGDIGRQEWTIALPASGVGVLDIQANASSVDVRLPGGSITSLTADVNATDLFVDAGDGSLAALDVSLNAGRARITLGQGPATGSIDLNAGVVDLCVPADAALRLSLNDQLTFAHNLRSHGLSQAGTTWTRSGSSADAIDLHIEGNAASLTLDPDGGCR